MLTKLLVKLLTNTNDLGDRSLEVVGITLFLDKGGKILSQSNEVTVNRGHSIVNCFHLVGDLVGTSGNLLYGCLCSGYRSNYPVQIGYANLGGGHNAFSFILFILKMGKQS
ncbi:MAG: hypothetical protein E7645_04005 [Ruminococcaceae bacterium]|nr:hypothetical protein [Oscillospiraceae bacterium]